VHLARALNRAGLATSAPRADELMIAAEMSMPVQRMLDGDGWPPVSSAYPRVEQMYQTLFEERAREHGARARGRAQSAIFPPPKRLGTRTGSERWLQRDKEKNL
jgi:hypothetical protein